MRDSALREDGDVATDGDTDADAATAFANRAQADHGDAIQRLIAFGDAVRGDDNGVHSSVEILVAVEDLDDAQEQHLEQLGETVGIEHEVVVEVYVLPAERFETQQDHPLIQQALDDGQVYV